MKTKIMLIWALAFAALAAIVIAANSAPVLNSVVGGAKEDDPLSNNLAGYWDFDEFNATYALDMTSNANHGLVVGANKTFGKLGYGMLFDGVDDFINISVNSFSNTSDTVSAWIRLKANTDQNDYTIFSTLPNDGLVGWWDFNGDSKDKTSNANDGTLVGDAAVTAADRKSQGNKALALDGTGDYVSVSDSVPISSASLTISAWIKPSSVTGYHAIAAQYTNTNDRRRVQFYMAGSGLGVTLSQNGATTSGTEGAGTVVIDVWNYAAVTFDASSGTAQLYLNGAAVGSPISTGFSSLYDSDRPFYIGVREIDNGVFDLHFQGSIDDVRIYNRALSATEVAQLYDKGLELIKEDDNLAFNAGNLTVNYNVSAWNVDEWHHAAGAYSSAGIELYADGKNVKSSVNVTRALNITNAYIGGLTTYFNGSIDEINIWNAALSADEISKRYSRGIGVGNITTQMPLAVAPNTTNTSDKDGDGIYTAVDWWRCKDDGSACKLNASTGKPDDANMVLFMPFDKKSDTGMIDDYSSSHNNGRVKGGATFTNDSAMGLGAYSFDGATGYINVSSVPSSLRITNTVSVSFWVKANTISSYTIIKQRDAAGNGDYWINTNSNNTFQCSAAGGYGTAFTPVLPNLTQNWNHIVLTFQNNQLKCYGNGVLGDTDTDTNSLPPMGSTDPILIGGGYPAGASPTTFFNGMMDEVRIYNRILTETEASQLYMAGIKRGLTLNHSQTRIGEIWNATVTLYDNSTAASAAKNFTFPKISSCGYAPYEKSWRIAAEDNCTLSRNINAAGGNISITGEGAFTFNGFNITNFAKISLSGISATQRLMVFCNLGGCFR